ncbi:MAG TPA: PaaI family thioesterase [Mycobacteriales bacterium]|nr:PaaI family thioesterase [Mycobacteriales bacterium]
MTDVAQQDVLGGFVRWLGLEFVETSGDRVVISWDVRPDHHQPYGLVHGGVHCSVIESAASVGGALWFGERGKVVGVSNQTDFLRAVSEGRLTATALPIHRGRLQQLWAVEIRDAGDRLVALGQVRLQNISDDRLERRS